MNEKYNRIYGGGRKSGERIKNDFYATEPLAIELAQDMFKETKLNKRVWECACGDGNISEVLLKLGYNVKSSDLIDRGYGKQIDFLKYNKKVKCDILTNPPFKELEKFVIKAMEILEDGYKFYCFCKIQTLEGKARKKLFEKYNPKFVYVYSMRAGIIPNNDLKHNKLLKTFCFCWIIFEKGYCGLTELRWI